MDNNSIFIHTPVHEWHHIYIYPWYSEHALSPPLLYFIINYIDAPSLEHKNDHDGYNPRNKAKGYLELSSLIIIIILILEIKF